LSSISSSCELSEPSKTKDKPLLLTTLIICVAYSPTKQHAL
jgi:hypothetical protein